MCFKPLLRSFLQKTLSFAFPRRHDSWDCRLRYLQAIRDTKTISRSRTDTLNKRSGYGADRSPTEFPLNNMFGRLGLGRFGTRFRVRVSVRVRVRVSVRVSVRVNYF